MKARTDEFIDLNRTFFELPRGYTLEADSDDLELNEALGLRLGKDFTWDALLKQHRIVLLAEAGAGKTEEIRQTAIKLRSEGKSAFFVRLEHIPDSLEGAFEEGSYEEFKNWLQSNKEGWLLLDSIDEARLKHTLDFEQSIRKIANELSPALQRVHIVITGRVDAWRPKTDLDLCNKQLEYEAPDEEKDDELEDGYEEFFFPEESHETETKRSGKTKDRDSGFKIYSIKNLSSEQVENFIQKKGISDSSDFLREIERQDAWSYTTRPQDLIEVIDFWIKNKRIGSRLELVESSIERRLQERKENTASVKPISIGKAREGIKLIAAACTLKKMATVIVPDGTERAIGIDVRSILPDWSSEDCKTLLSRPIFDDAIYGTVRFHHRSVREYLTAEWIIDVLEKGTPRKAIEGLFIQKQHGIKVLIPSMRPILS